MWQAAPLITYEFDTYSPSSDKPLATKDVLESQLTDQNRPDVDEGEQGDISELLKREKEGEQMVGYALGKPVQWMESVACKGSWHDPFMMALVESLVDQGMVQAPVDPVDTEVREENEQWELQQVVEAKRGVRWCIVQFAVPTDFE